jgi:threonine/homoserine/homoserine lactone efflux protein
MSYYFKQRYGIESSIQKLSLFCKPLMQTDSLIAFITASALLTIMPGPDIIFVLIQSITNGKKSGIITAFGLGSGIIIHTSLIALGVSQILKQNENIFFFIKLLGALYLFFLAYKVYQSSSKIDLKMAELERKSIFSLFKQGFIMNVLNPKVTIFFLAFFPGFINYSESNIMQQIMLLGLIFMLLTWLIFSSVSILADKMTSVLRENLKFQKTLKIVQIVVFIGIGIFILF